MRSKTALPLVILLFALFTVLALSNLTAPSVVEANILLQDTPRLDGVNVYFTEAGQEASRFNRADAGLSRLAGIMREMGANLYTLEWRTGFPTDADLIVIAGPVNDLTPDQIARLWAYLSGGGRLLLLADPVVAPIKALPASSGLFALMYADMGMRARQDMVVTVAQPDAAATEEPSATPTGPKLINQFMATNINTDHPTMKGITTGLTFFGARSLELDSGIQGYTVTPLAYTTEDFYGESAYENYMKTGASQLDIATDTTYGRLPLAAAFENTGTGARIILIGDREFATNGGGLQTSPPSSASFLYPDNVRFLVNAVAWLLNVEPVELAFPTPAPTATVTITASPTSSPTPTATPTATPS